MRSADTVVKAENGRGPRLALMALVGAALFAASPARAASQADPCNSLSFRQSAVVNMSSATTTAIVALNANHGIFVCGFALTIAGSATTAATAALEYGTGTNCASNVTTLTGTFGSNDAAVSTAPTQVTYGDGTSTVATVPPASALCVVTAGNAVFVQGIITYVQGSGQSYP